MCTLPTVFWRGGLATSGGSPSTYPSSRSPVWGLSASTRRDARDAVASGPRLRMRRDSAHVRMSRGQRLRIRTPRSPCAAASESARGPAASATPLFAWRVELADRPARAIVARYWPAIGRPPLIPTALSEDDAGMPTRTQRIQPFRSEDGNHRILLAFARRAARILDPEFDPPDRWRDVRQDGIEHTYHETVRSVGDGRHGFRVTHYCEYQPQSGVQVVDRVVIAAYGLPDGGELVLECVRSWYDPRFVELHVAAATAQVADRVRDAFLEEFGRQEPLRTSEIPVVLGNARAAISAGEWRAAEMFAKAILQTNPREADALCYLGVARGAQGDLEGAEEALAMALDADPSHYDALYNLGVLYLLRSRPQDAVEAFLDSLHVKPDNHPVLFQLGRAYEAVGDRHRAREAYRAAIRTSPNPQGYWGYRGMDYTEEARAALQRVAGGADGLGPDTDP